jgi:hypothetical protein
VVVTPILSPPPPTLFCPIDILGLNLSPVLYITILCALSSGCRRLKDEAEVQSRPSGVYCEDKVKSATQYL